MNRPISLNKTRLKIKQQRILVLQLIINHTQENHKIHRLLTKMIQTIQLMNRQLRQAITFLLVVEIKQEQSSN